MHPSFPFFPSEYCSVIICFPVHCDSTIRRMALHAVEEVMAGAGHKAHLQREKSFSLLEQMLQDEGESLPSHVPDAQNRIFLLVASRSHLLVTRDEPNMPCMHPDPRLQLRRAGLGRLACWRLADGGLRKMGAAAGGTKDGQGAGCCSSSTRTSNSLLRLMRFCNPIPFLNPAICSC